MPWFDPSWYGRRWRPAPARRWRPGGASTRAVACPVATPAVFPTPPSSCGTPADRRPTPSAPDTVLRSWEREWWSHKPSSVCAPRRASRWSSLWDGRHRPPQAAYPQLERPGPGLAAYLALLRLGVAVPRPLPNARWALTPPFHPYPLDTGRSVLCGPVRRLAAPRRYLAVCPLELGLSSTRRSCRRTATIALHLNPRPEASSAAAGPASDGCLPPQAADEARQT